MSVAPEHAAFDSIPAPVTVVHGDEIVYANRAAVELTGIQNLVGTSVRAHIQRSLSPDESTWAEQLHAARLDGRDPTDRYWLRFSRVDGTEVTVHVQSAPGPRAGEHTHLYLAGPPEQVAVRALTDALLAASWNLVHLREEGAVLAAAADALSRLGFRVVILRFENDRFFHAMLRHDAAALEEIGRLTGAPMSNLPLPREQATEFAQSLEERRAIFIQDTHLLVDRFRSPEVAKAIKATMPRRSAVAPIFSEGQGWGVLTAQKDDLTPGEVGALALFAHRIGGALENVAHHRRALRRLDELNALQNKLVLQERLAALGEAAAVLAHEVRNPVGAILNAVALLNRRAGAEQPEVLHIIEEESLRLDRLVRDLLHLARPLQPKRVELDLRTVAERAIATVQGRHQGAVPQELVAAGPVRVLGDGFLLELAIENLLMNALRASPSRGKVQVTLFEEPGRACIAVDDMGPGISPEIAPRLFQPFFTTHATGTGLGLAVVRKVVEAHGGEVRVAASALGGARFEIELRGP